MKNSYLLRCLPIMWIQLRDPCWGKPLHSPISCKNPLIYTIVRNPSKPIGSPHWASVDHYFSLLLALSRGEQMFVHVSPEAAVHNTKESQLLHTIASFHQCCSIYPLNTVAWFAVPGHGVCKRIPVNSESVWCQTCLILDFLASRIMGIELLFINSPVCGVLQ